MSDPEQTSSTQTPFDAIAKRWALEREARLWAGVVLFVFVTMHLLNHALGIFGVAVMEAMQKPRMALWQSVPGTVALYGAFLVHVVLALKRMARRRFSRMPADEALQIVLGLLIPYLIIDHVVGTRVQSLLGYRQAYTAVLPRIWGDPALKQTALVICAWVHGCIGISQTFRSKGWYIRWRDPLLVVAGLVPLLALAGFVSAARELQAMDLQTEPLTRNDYFVLLDVIRWSLAAFAGAMSLVLAVIAWRVLHRRRSGMITIKYTGHGSVVVGRGTTVLEASRINGIPHPAICGGRGRCSTCRVAINSDLSDLPPVGPTERAMLQRISAPPNVRLGCQLRPAGDLSVQILLPILPAGGRLEAKDEAYRWGVERNVTVLFVDIRAFNTLARKQLPYDLVLLLNRFIREMTQAATAHGGRVDSFMADGLMAIFGLGSSTDAGAREAIMAARAMLKVVEGLNREFGAAMPIPLRVGIGIHTGPAIIAQIGDVEHGMLMTALGETVTIASRLEAATKDYLTDALVSAQTARASGLDLPRYEGKRLHIRGHDEPIILHLIDEREPPAKQPRPELSHS
ncbi:adenylate/guanylate cyclase domain-containing protein [Labrys wisconsinensis]|uniref:Adenylate cyclase n=1 Tax=Labrys wisconsinensis TaxID=425677 RepID=A0ABU0J166_9HYPH|nr:adenylate/guanylate cyclase domain-containing protein [Labrys wisconsinensis]MDQ0467054.1 adenylate cyclase [Labrys wisconsinensis]